MLRGFSFKYVLVLRPKPTLPWAIVFVLLQTSTFCSSMLMICLFYFADVSGFLLLSQLVKSQVVVVVVVVVVDRSRLIIFTLFIKVTDNLIIIKITLLDTSLSLLFAGILLKNILILINDEQAYCWLA